MVVTLYSPMHTQNKQVEKFQPINLSLPILHSSNLVANPSAYYFTYLFVLDHAVNSFDYVVDVYTTSLTM